MCWAQMCGEDVRKGWACGYSSEDKFCSEVLKMGLAIWRQAKVALGFPTLTHT